MRAARWLTIPAVIGVLVVTGLAVSTESREAFDARQLADDLTGADSTEGQPADSAAGGRLDDGSNLEIGSEAGRVGIELGGDQPIARPRSGTGVETELVLLRPVDRADGVGYRLGSDGRLEPVVAEEIAAGDIVVQPAGGGIDVLGTGADRVEVRPALAEPGGIAATAVDRSGTREQLLPDATGTIELDGGVVLVVPIEQAATTPTLGPEPSTEDGGPPWRWILVAALAAIVLAALAALYLRRPSEEAGGDTTASVARVPAPARFDELVGFLAADPDPARAIRVAFGVAERGMGAVSARLSTETPFEWNARMAETHPELSLPLTTLCDLFAAARFAPERPTLGDRDAAVAALRTLAAAAWDPNPGRPGHTAGARS